jgi:ComF family protein
MKNLCFDRLAHRLQFLVFYAREYYFPAGCSICGASLLDAKEAWYGLCSICHSRVDAELEEGRANEHCDRCGKPLVSEQARCLSCRKREDFVVDGITVLFPYMGKYRRLLSSYKFGKNLAAGHFLAEKMRVALDGACPSGACIVPVPPRPGKIRKAGWDQVEYLARLLERGGGRTSGLPVSRCLKRLPSQSQKELGRDNRMTNLRGRIVPIRQVPKTCVLIDDVMTTGSTLEACAAALKDGGAHSVSGLCLFYDL